MFNIIFQYFHLLHLDSEDDVLAAVEIDQVDPTDESGLLEKQKDDYVPMGKSLHYFICHDILNRFDELSKIIYIILTDCVWNIES